MNSTPAVIKPPVAAIAAGIVLSIVTLLLWGLLLATVASLGRSDAAGNGLSQAYAAIQLIVLWLLLTVLTIFAGAKGEGPEPQGLPRSSSFRFPVSLRRPPPVCSRNPTSRHISGPSSFRRWFRL